MRRVRHRERIAGREAARGTAAIDAQQVEARDRAALVAAHATEVVEPAQQGLRRLQRAAAGHGLPFAFGEELRERPVGEALEAARRDRDGLGGEEALGDPERGFVERAQVLGLAKPLLEFLAQRRAGLELRDVGRVLERAHVVALRGCIPAEGTQHVLGMAAEIRPYGRRPAHALQVHRELVDARGREPLRRERAVGRHQPAAQRLVGHRGLRRLPALHGRGAAAIGIGRVAAQLDVDGHRQPRLHRARAVGEAVHEPGLAAGAVLERAAVHAVGHAHEFEESIGAREPARVEQAVRVLGDAHAGLPVAALDGREAGAEGLGDGAPGLRAHQHLVARDAVGGRRFGQPVGEAGAGLLGRLQHRGRGDEQQRLGRVSGGEEGGQREAGEQAEKKRHADHCAAWGRLDRATKGTVRAELVEASRGASTSSA
jgi:hypothetical protein